jgi:hypothetical protein
MNRLHTTAAALLVFAIAGSGCARNKSLPNQLAPARLTTIGVNAYLWRAALDTVSFAPLLQADANGGVIDSRGFLARCPAAAHYCCESATGAERIDSRSWNLQASPTISISAIGESCS